MFLFEEQRAEVSHLSYSFLYPSFPVGMTDSFLKDIGVHCVYIYKIIELEHWWHSDSLKAVRGTIYDEDKRNDWIKLMEIDLFASNMVILIISLEK